MLKLLLGLTREANNNIGRDAAGWHTLADSRDDPSVYVDRVAPPHCFENFVITGLNGNIDVLADLRQGGNCIQNAIGKIAGMRRQKADALELFNLTQRPHQIAKIRAIRAQVSPVAVYNLSQQR